MNGKEVCWTTRNLDEGKRKKILAERLASLCKKAHELTILCDVKVSIISFTPGETDIFAWPSLDEANDIVNSYLACPEKQRKYKLVEHEAYLQAIVNDREEDIRKLEEMVEEKKMENLFNQLVEGRKRFDEFNVRDIKYLLKLFVVKRAELDQRKIQLRENIANEIGANDNNAREENDGHP
ncbi:agamous-like MADS-box protein AGL92 [Solanum dulcamara]|uniref:agamous-like MADS-box protein AGL92 n=1 Tax=Solanum dulcamara TaxID=45834 RepID=UPI0024858327|nr:agamous-like MADS-box protein AGL92 [Solanum dulcamara]